MILAILALIKRMTRRAVKWRKVAPGLNLGFSGLRAVETPEGWVLESDTRTSSEWRCAPTPCPYGKVGDRLWVRETWAHGIHAMAAKRDEDGPFVYAATHREDQRLGNRWKPSIHMPRAACRIRLEITAVRVERLQSISESDAQAEGIEGGLHWDGVEGTAADLIEWPLKSTTRPFANEFAVLWCAINGDGAWDANPWVWVVEFKRVESAHD